MDSMTPADSQRDPQDHDLQKENAAHAAGSEEGIWGELPVK